jgi:ATP-dependent DNA ligase
MKMTKQTSKPTFPELRGSVEHIRYPVWCEIKYDGELCYIIYAGDTICTVNKYGAVREDFPALTEINQQLKAKGIKAGIFLAELYFEEGKIQLGGELNSNKTNDLLNLKVFDVLQLDEDLVSEETFLDRREGLVDCLGDLAIEGVVANDRGQMEQYFHEKVQEGFEGIVVKQFDSHLVMGPCSWAKMKHKDQTDYKVSLVEVDKERIEVDVPHPVHGALSMIQVGCKAPNKYKKHIKVGDMVTIEHQGVMLSGSLKHPVLIPKPEWK